MEKLVCLYEYGKKDRIIKTQYGEISYLDWLRMEKKRIKKAPDRRAEIWVSNSGLASLWVNHTKDCRCKK